MSVWAFEWMGLGFKSIYWIDPWSPEFASLPNDPNILWNDQKRYMALGGAGAWRVLELLLHNISYEVWISIGAHRLSWNHYYQRSSQMGKLSVEILTPLSTTSCSLQHDRCMFRWICLFFRQCLHISISSVAVGVNLFAHTILKILVPCNSGLYITQICS